LDPPDRDGVYWTTVKPHPASVVVIVTLVASVSGLAQSDRPAEPPVRFDAVSVKPNESSDAGGTIRVLADRGEVVNLPIKVVIASAYGLRNDQVAGGPSWAERDRFDIKAAAGRSVTPSELKLMYQSLLADRFQLRAHHETRQLPVWSLGLARSDGKLGPSMRPCQDHCTVDGWIKYGATVEWMERATTIADIIPTLASLARGPVIDHTGLTGKYDLELHWTLDTTATDTGAVTLFTALKEQLGLALESSRGPVDVLVIDRLERPTPD
jgi:uncharacterized protein (TIGR03435 family)